MRLWTLGGDVMEGFARCDGCDAVGDHGSLALTWQQRTLAGPGPSTPPPKRPLYKYEYVLAVRTTTVGLDSR